MRDWSQKRLGTMQPPCTGGCMCCSHRLSAATKWLSARLPPSLFGFRPVACQVREAAAFTSQPHRFEPPSVRFAPFGHQRALVCKGVLGGRPQSGWQLDRFQVDRFWGAEAPSPRGQGSSLAAWPVSRVDSRQHGQKLDPIQMDTCLGFGAVEPGAWGLWQQLSGLAGLGWREAATQQLERLRFEVQGVRVPC